MDADGLGPEGAMMALCVAREGSALLTDVRWEPIGSLPRGAVVLLLGPWESDAMRLRVLFRGTVCWVLRQQLIPLEEDR